jgi:hypothetical protein
MINRTWLILAFIILVVCASYFYQAIPDCLRNRVVCFQSQAPAPYRYRILQPILEQAISPKGSEDAVLLTDLAIQSVLTSAIFIGLYNLLRQWGSQEQTIIGLFILALVMVVSYHFFLRSIQTTIELCCVVWGLRCLQSMQRSSSSPA